MHWPLQGTWRAGQTKGASHAAGQHIGLVVAPLATTPGRQRNRDDQVAGHASLHQGFAQAVGQQPGRLEAASKLQGEDKGTRRPAIGPGGDNPPNGSPCLPG